MLYIVLAFLMAVDLPIPKKIFAHGWWTNEGEKISKSLGNVIDPVALSAEFGVDQLRYFLMRHINFGNDGNFARKELIRYINSDLANNLGNLVQRVLSMIHKNCAGQIPNYNQLQSVDKNLLQKSYDLLPKLRELIEQQNFSIYLEQVISLSAFANEYINEQAPWQLKKTNLQRMNDVLYSLSEIIRVIAIYLKPFMPDSAEKILFQLGINNSNNGFADLKQKISVAQKLPDLQIIFPKVIDE